MLNVIVMNRYLCVKTKPKSKSNVKNKVRSKPELLTTLLHEKTVNNLF